MQPAAAVARAAPAPPGSCFTVSAGGGQQQRTKLERDPSVPNATAHHLCPRRHFSLYSCGCRRRCRPQPARLRAPPPPPPQRGTAGPGGRTCTAPPPGTRARAAAPIAAVNSSLLELPRSTRTSTCEAVLVPWPGNYNIYLNLVYIAAHLRPAGPRAAPPASDSRNAAQRGHGLRGAALCPVSCRRCAAVLVQDRGEALAVCNGALPNWADEGGRLLPATGRPDHTAGAGVRKAGRAGDRTGEREFF
eukprot:SAG22_NODE_87_length_21437_cov_14.162480_8_plen_247_part_00